MCHFYPEDRSRLYRSNKILKDVHESNIDYDSLAKKLTEQGSPTTSDEIRELLVSAYGAVSSDTPISVTDTKKTSLSNLAAIPRIFATR